MVSTHWQQSECHSVGFPPFNITISEHLLNANLENSNNLYKPGETIQTRKCPFIPSLLLAQKTAGESILSYPFLGNRASGVMWCRERAGRNKFLR